jgi:hypothetical protein
MTRPSRGVSDIQEKARGNDMKSCGMKKGGEMMDKMSGKKDPRKTAPSNTKKRSSKLSVKGSPMDKGSLGPAMSMGAVPGYKKGGMIDGCAKKGHTKGKMV